MDRDAFISLMFCIEIDAKNALNALEEELKESESELEAENIDLAQNAVSLVGSIMDILVAVGTIHDKAYYENKR